MPVPAMTSGLRTGPAAQWTQKMYANAMLSALLTAALLRRCAPCRFRHLFTPVADLIMNSLRSLIIFLSTGWRRIQRYHTFRSPLSRGPTSHTGRDSASCSHRS